MQIRHPLADPHRPRLLITGASTRAAAWSAIRAGFFPVCADRFADEDLRQIAEVHTREQLLRRLRSWCLHDFSVASMSTTEVDFIPRKWILEQYRTPLNHRRFGPFLGPKDIIKSRGVMGFSTYLSSVAIPTLAEKWGFFQMTEPANDDISVDEMWTPPIDGKWVEKPVFSAGGRNVRFWDDDAEAEPLFEPSYLQEYRDGQPMSAIFVANSSATLPVELIGLTEQIIGDATAGAPTRFAYCGNIAPVSLPDNATAVMKKIGAVLAEKLELRGIFGVDFIWDGTTPWVIEVNPRYTASCELLELAHGRALLRDHWQAWLPNEPLPLVGEAASQPRAGVIGKLILYARSPVTAPDFARFLRRRSEWTVPWLADIPRIGTSFQPGDPLCTVFATGPNAVECQRKLARRAQRVRSWFHDLPDPR